MSHHPSTPCWQYALRFRVEERFLDSKSEVFELEASSIRSATALEFRLYLVAAVRYPLWHHPGYGRSTRWPPHSG